MGSTKAMHLLNHDDRQTIRNIALLLLGALVTAAILIAVGVNVG